MVLGHAPKPARDVSTCESCQSYRRLAWRLLQLITNRALSFVAALHDLTTLALNTAALACSARKTCLQLREAAEPAYFGDVVGVQVQLLEPGQVVQALRKTAEQQRNGTEETVSLPAESEVSGPGGRTRVQRNCAVQYVFQSRCMARQHDLALRLRRWGKGPGRQDWVPDRGLMVRSPQLPIPAVSACDQG